MTLLRKELGRKDEASKGGGPLNALFCHTYARRQLEAMVQELDQRDAMMDQYIKKEKYLFLSSEAAPQRKKTARPHGRTNVKTWPPLLSLARFLKAPSPPPATSAASSSWPEVQCIVTNVFADAFPDWWRWPGDIQGDDDSSMDAPPSRPQDETWHMLWTWSKPRMESASLLAHQQVNHIPRSQDLTRKDFLVRHLDRHMALSSSSSSSTGGSRVCGRHQKSSSLLSYTKKSTYPFFHIMPQTFALPQAYTSFVATFRDGSSFSSSSSSSFSDNISIIKPFKASRGRGIKLVNGILDVIHSEPVVIQRYVSKPLLLNGYIDLRLYVLVNSFQPTLEAFTQRVLLVFARRPSSSTT